MSNFFSVSEVVQIGIEIEKNGKDFYNTVASSSKNKEVKKMWEYLANEEEQHIKTFEEILSTVEKYEPPEAYPGEYFSYLKALSEQHVFTQKNKGKEIAKKVKNDTEAIELAIGFEKDSILFYYEMKKLVKKDTSKTIDKLIEQEQGHLSKLSDLKNSLIIKKLNK